MSQVTILVAEDFIAFREFLCRELRRSGFRVVAVSDGLAAVQKAEQLRPDLILLDIGLSALDGLAVARRIRLLNPESRIVFLSHESAPDIVYEALGLGSRGYIHKTCARYLLPVVKAILDRGPAVAIVCRLTGWAATLIMATGPSSILTTLHYWRQPNTSWLRP